MLSTVEFPNLFNGELKINRTAFSILGIDVYWYGVLITLGVILGFIYAIKRAKLFGMLPDAVFDTAFIGLFGGLVGARIYYCIFVNLNPNSIEKYNLITTFTEIRDGGLAIYGGIIGAVLTVFIYTKIKRIKILPILDLAGFGFFIGQGIGRWGNFLNQECFGNPTAGNLPWGMTGNIIKNSADVIQAQSALPAGEYALVHPCFLYESLWCFAGLVILHFYSKKLRSFDGEIFLLYAIWYGTGRGFIEGLRTDSLYAGNVKISQLVGFASAILAFIIFVYFKVKLTKNKNYVMLSNNEDNKRYLEGYKDRIKLQNEKNAAKKALNDYYKTEKNTPSILGEGTSNITLDNDNRIEDSIDKNKDERNEKPI